MLQTQIYVLTQTICIMYCLQQSKYTDVLALLFIIQDDYDRAKYYTGTCLQNFLEVILLITYLLIRYYY